MYDTDRAHPRHWPMQLAGRADRRNRDPLLYRRCGGHALAFVEKRSPVIHLVPAGMPGLRLLKRRSRGKGITTNVKSLPVTAVDFFLDKEIRIAIREERVLNLRSCRPHQGPKERLPWFRFVKVRASAFAMRWASSSGKPPPATSIEPRRHCLRQQERALDPHRAVRGVCGRGREGCLAPPPGVDAWKPCSGRGLIERGVPLSCGSQRSPLRRALAPAGRAESRRGILRGGGGGGCPNKSPARGTGLGGSCVLP